MAVLDIAVKPLCSWSDTMEMGMQIESVADGGGGGGGGGALVLGGVLVNPTLRLICI